MVTFTVKDAAALRAVYQANVVTREMQHALGDVVVKVEQSVSDLERERARFDALWAALPFPLCHYFGGDVDEAREAADGIAADLADYKEMQKHSARVSRWLFDRMRKEGK